MTKRSATFPQAPWRVTRPRWQKSKETDEAAAASSNGLSEAKQIETDSNLLQQIEAKQMPCSLTLAPRFGATNKPKVAPDALLPKFGVLQTGRLPLELSEAASSNGLSESEARLPWPTKLAGPRKAAPPQAATPAPIAIDSSCSETSFGMSDSELGQQLTNRLTAQGSSSASSSMAPGKQQQQAGRRNRQKRRRMLHNKIKAEGRSDPSFQTPTQKRRERKCNWIHKKLMGD